MVYLDQAYYRSIIGIFDDVTGGVPGDTVMGHESEEQRTQDIMLRGTSIQCVKDDMRFYSPRGQIEVFHLGNQKFSYR